MFLGKLFCLCVRQQLIDTFSLTSYIYDKKFTTFLHKEKQHMYITACGITWQGKLDDPILTYIVFLLKKLVWPGFGLNRAEGLSRPNTGELAFLFHSSIHFTKTQFSDFHACKLSLSNTRLMYSTNDNSTFHQQSWMFDKLLVHGVPSKINPRL